MVVIIKNMDKINIICIGGLCFGATLLGREKSLEFFNEIKSPVNNVKLKNGFLGVHKLFDGTFEKTILNDDYQLKYEYYPKRKHPEWWTDENYIFPHIDFRLPDTKDKLRNRFKNTIEFIKENKDNYWFLYSLNDEDIKLTINDIQKELNILSKYIDINRIIFIGSKLYTDEELLSLGITPAKRHANYNWRNPAFGKIVGNRYVVVEPSNNYNASADFLISYFKNNFGSSTLI